LEHESRESVLERYAGDLVASQCEALMFAKPKDYLKKFEKVLSIQLSEALVSEYIEVRSRGGRR
jgi:hypothetical protein